MDKQCENASCIHSLTSPRSWEPPQAKSASPIAFLLTFPPLQIYGHITNVDYFVAELLFFVCV